jgi:choline monooxygenase
MYRDAQQDAARQVADIAQTAAQTDETFWGVGGEVYTSENLLALEQERIFKHEWACVGRHDELPDPGDYFTTDVGIVPIIVARQDDGELRAMLNVCAHRLAQVATGSGNAKNFSCLYHGWVYGRDGRLLGANRMPADYDLSNCALRPVQLELWNGFIYVNVDPDAPSLGAALGPLTELFRPFHLERMQILHKDSEIWNGNWKIATENFLESYHLEMGHKGTIGPLYPQESLKMVAEGDGFAFHRFDSPAFEDASIDPAIARPNPDLTDEHRGVTYVGGVFPNHLFTVAGDQITWMRAQPHGVGQTLVEWGVCGAFNLPRGTKADPSHPNMIFLREIPHVNIEDKAIVEAVQNGARSGLVRPSRLHPNEHGLLTFARFLARRLQSN